MGLCLGLVVLHSPPSLRKRLGEIEPPYSALNSASAQNASLKAFVKAPVSFFKGRKPLWWAWWLVRAVMLTAAVVCFIVLLRNFYIFREPCGWCKYLSCLVSYTEHYNTPCSRSFADQSPINSPYQIGATLVDYIQIRHQTLTACC